MPPLEPSFELLELPLALISPETPTDVFDVIVKASAAMFE